MSSMTEAWRSRLSTPHVCWLLWKTYTESAAGSEINTEVTTDAETTTNSGIRVVVVQASKLVDNLHKIASSSRGFC